MECFRYSDDHEDRIVSREDAELAAGAVVYASEALVDELFQDVATLHEEGANSVADSDGVFMVLEELPPAYARSYTALFAKRLTVAAVSMVEKFTRPGYAELSCVTEELLLRLLIDEAFVVVDVGGLMSGEITVRATDGPMWHGSGTRTCADLTQQTTPGLLAWGSVVERATRIEPAL